MEQQEESSAEILFRDDDSFPPLTHISFMFRTPEYDTYEYHICGYESGQGAISMPFFNM